jgi:hypothetical protein
LSIFLKNVKVAMGGLRSKGDLGKEKILYVALGDIWMFTTIPIWGVGRICTPGRHNFAETNAEMFLSAVGSMPG